MKITHRTGGAQVGTLVFRSSEHIMNPCTTPNQVPRPESGRDSRLVWLVVALLMLVGSLVYPLRAQEASRFALTASVWDDQSVAITGYPIGPDRAERDGDTFSDKAPGQPLLAVPFYGIGRLAGMQPAMEFQVDGNLSLWWVTLWSATLPSIALFLMMIRLGGGRSQSSAVIAATMVSTGTLLLPFSTVLFGHLLAAVFLVGSFNLLTDRQAPKPFWAGLLAGLAVATEYTTVLGVVALGVWAAFRFASNRLPAFLLGGMPIAAAVALYNYAAFGSPFAISYQFNAFNSTGLEPSNIATMFSAPSVDNLVALMFSGRGLLFATPLVLVAIAGLVLLVRKADSRAESVLQLTVVASFFLLAIFWGNPWGGESPGARYTVPALAFLVPGLLTAIKRFPVLTFGTWVISFGTMALATFSDALAITRTDPTGLRFWLSRALNGEWIPSIAGITLGRQGQVAFAAVALATSTGLVVSIWSRTRISRERPNQEFTRQAGQVNSGGASTKPLGGPKDRDK